MKIVDNRGAPPELVRLVDQLGQEVEGVNQVILDAFVPELRKDRAIGAFEPTAKIIIIDLGHCITDYRWMKYGALYIANVWLNMVVSVFHEFAHADQLNSDDITIEEMEQDPELHAMIEDDAITKAMTEAHTYFGQGHITPPLREMGWAGEKIAEVLNNTYKDIPEQVMEEIEVHKSGGAAELMAASSALPRFNEENIELLKENIDREQGGVKLGGRYYMTMAEFVSSTIEQSLYN